MHITGIFNNPRGTARGLITAVAAVALTMGALATQTPGVSAAASLSVPANPVTVPWGGSTTSTTLSWNLGGIAKAQLKVQENGGAVVLSQPAASQTGSTPLTVTYGKSYTATLADVANPATSYATLSITTKRPPLGPLDLGCAAQCITGVSVEPHGTFADFHITTNEPAHFEVQVSTAAPNANHVFANVASAAFNLSNVKDWSTHLLNLTPNTSYFYVVKATDTDGHSAYKEGQFKTLKRRAEVTFTSIHMIEDSDILSACDCTFWFQAGGQAPKNSGFLYVGSGETISPNVKFTIDNPSNTILVRVEAVDDDQEALIDICGADWGPFWSNGSTNCLDWSSTSKTVDLTLSGMQESKENIYTLTADSGPVKFTASVSVKVSYVP